MIVGELIRDWRTKHRYGMRAMAKRVGVSSATLNRLERGGDVDGETLVKLWLWVFSDGGRSQNRRPPTGAWNESRKYLGDVMSESNSETKSHAKESEASATPGPWKASRLIVHDANGNGIAKVTQRGNEPGHITGEGTANARLIAASPELLEALQWILNIADVNYEQDERLRSQGARTLKRISDKARRAIAKATGATP